MITKLATDNSVLWWCPGCKRVHRVTQDQWQWNLDRDKPTFRPSVNTRYRYSYMNEVYTDLCHCFVTDGIIQFLPDCTHNLAGQFVPIPEWPYEEGTYDGVQAG